MAFKSIFHLLSAGLVVCICASAVGQKLPSGPQVLTFFSDVDDSDQPYGLYLPPHFKANKKYPLVVMLHGAGSNHRLSLRRVFGKSNAPGESDVEATHYFPAWKDVDYIVVSAYARGTAGYQGFREKDVYDMLADVKKRFPIDENRIYLTGLSMGGGGVLWIGLSNPDIWAAIAAVCPAAPAGTEVLAPNALNLPAHFFHGDIDQAVPVTASRDWVKNLQALGSKVEYTEYPGVNHNSWEKAYENEFIFDWFKQFKRNPYPERVRFVTTNYAHSKAFWVQFDQLTPGILASIDAKFTGTNQLDIATSALEAFSLTLTGHPKFKAGKPLQVTLDGKKLDLPAGSAAAFTKINGNWTVARYTAVPLAKGPGAEGPISRAFASRHVYVYGTLDNPSPDVLKARIDTASRAAEWSVNRGEFLGRIKFFPHVIADKDVRPSDLESSNLILFGTAQTNSLIAKYSDRLPLQLNAGMENYGLFYIFPIDGRYVTISSGLAWWTDADTKGWRYMPPVHHVAAAYKDFILFKGSAKNVLAEGYFDNNWHLPEAATKAMEATKAVRLK